MKEWKTIVVVVLVMLLVGVLVYMAVDKNQTTPVAANAPVVITPEQALLDLQKRIGQLVVLKEEQTLTRDIMVIQQEIRELQLKAQAPPVIEGEFIPIDKLPEEIQKQD